MDVCIFQTYHAQKDTTALTCKCDIYISTLPVYEGLYSTMINMHDPGSCSAMKYVSLNWPSVVYSFMRKGYWQDEDSGLHAQVRILLLEVQVQNCWKSIVKREDFDHS